MEQEKIERIKYTTTLDKVVLAKLAAKAKFGYGSANKVIEALVNKYIDCLDDNSDKKDKSTK